MIRLEPRFAELAAMTNFSFLRGASHPEEMVARAAELGLAGIGIADRNTLAGVVRAHVFARENKAAVAGMRVVPGARLAFVDGAPDVLAYPKDRAAYGRLCRILTAGNLRAPKGECHLRVVDLLEHDEGLQVVVLEQASGTPFSPCGRRWTREARPDEGSGAQAPSRRAPDGADPSPLTPLPQGERGTLTRKGKGDGRTLSRLREAFGA